MASAETILFEVEVQTDDTASQQLGEVDESVDSLEQSFQDLQKRSQVTAEQLENATVEASQDMSSSFQRAESSAEDATSGIRSAGQAADDFTERTSTLNASASTTANTLGIELVQGATDARFGMVGLANQIPLIQEQFVRLRQESGSTSAALSTLAGTFTNPGTGIIAAVTLLLTFKEPLVNFFTDSAESSKNFTESLKEQSPAIKQLIDDLGPLEQRIKEIQDTLQVESDRLDFLTGDVRSFEQAVERTIAGRGLQQIEVIQSRLEGSSDAAQRLRSTLREAGVNVDNVLSENLVTAREEIQKNRDTFRKFARDTAEFVADEQTAEVLASSIEERLNQVREAQQAQIESPIFDTTQADAAEEELRELREAFQEVISAQEGVSRADPAFDDLRRRARRLQQRLQALQQETDVPEAPDPPDVLDATDEEEQITLDTKIEPPDEEELDAFDRVLGDVQDRISSINSRPFLSGAAKAENRVQAIATRIRQAQRAGAEFSRQEINGLIRGLDLAEDEAEQVREALRGSGEEAGQAQGQVNQKLARGINLAFRLGEELAGAFQKGDVEAQQLLGTVLQIVGQAVAISNPAAGAALGGIGGIISSFDEGGYTGSGAPDQVAGVVHRGEFVMPAPVVEELGVGTLRGLQAMVEGQMHVSGQDLRRVAGVPGFQEGGLVQRVTQPAPTGRGDGVTQEQLQQVVDEVRGVADEIRRVKQNPAPAVVDRTTARDVTEARDVEVERSRSRVPDPNNTGSR
jgi:hypothetical protein